MESNVTTLQELMDTLTPPGEREVDPDRVRRAIVTGGSTGLGRYIAIELAKDGCDVGITYAHNRDDAELTAEAVRTFGRQCFIEQMDLETPEAAEPVVDHLADSLGGLDIFVSNAGTMVMQRMPVLDLGEMQRLFNINTFGAVLGTQRALRHMLGMTPDADDEGLADKAGQAARWMVSGNPVAPRQTPGRIVIVTSTHEKVASPADTAYTMTKHALGGFVKCAAFSTAGLNVTVNALAPGEIATPINGMHPEDGLDTDRDSLPAKRAGHPTEIARAVKFLASDQASFINGVSYDADGGLAIAQPMAMKNYRALV